MKVFQGIGTLISFILITIFSTWVTSELWGWYVTPAFNLAVPKLYIIFGLMLFISYFMKTTKSEKSYSTLAIEQIAKSVTVLAVGWTVQAIFS